MITSSIINSGPTLSVGGGPPTTTATNDGVARRRRLWVTPRGPVEVAD